MRAKLLDVVELVRRDDERRLAAQRKKKRAKTLGLDWVEPAQRLVEHHDVGMTKKRLRDHDALSHSVRERANGRVRLVRQVHDFDEFVGRLRGILLCHPLKPRIADEQRPYAPFVRKIGILRKNREPPAVASRIERTAGEDANFSRIGNHEAGNRHHPCSLACAVSPNESGD